MPGPAQEPPEIVSVAGAYYVNSTSACTLALLTEKTG